MSLKIFWTILKCWSFSFVKKMLLRKLSFLKKNSSYNLQHSTCLGTQFIEAQIAQPLSPLVINWAMTKLYKKNMELFFEKFWSLYCIPSSSSDYYLTRFAIVSPKIPLFYFCSFFNANFHKTHSTKPRSLVADQLLSFSIPYTLYTIPLF